MPCNKLKKSSKIRRKKRIIEKKCTCIIIACSDGQHGYNCQEDCNINCGVLYKCDRITGLCKGGCQIGWKGNTCSKSKNVHSNCLTINEP